MVTSSRPGQAGVGGTDWLEKAKSHLRKADPVLAGLIADRPDFDPRRWITELPCREQAEFIMSVSTISVVAHSTDRHAAVQRYQLLLGTPPEHEFTIPERALTVTVFPGLALISGTADALASVRDLRATAFVDSLAETRAQLAESGWTTEGSLGAGNSLLARDPDGMLAEFVEISGGTA
jgi:hypothetical protein